MSLLKSKNFQMKLIAVVIFAAVSLIFCYPSLQGKVLNQYDIKQGRGSTSEIKKYREDHNRQILWTNSAFSGMPATLLSVIYDSELLRHVPRIFKIFPRPANIIFLLMLGFYILLLSLKVDLRKAIEGGIAYGLSSYYLVYLAAGHNTKVHSLAYLPGMLAGLIWLYQHKKLFLGLGMVALFFGLEIQGRHPQMMYYMLFALIIYAVYQLTEYIKRKEFVEFLKITGIAIVGVLIGVASSYSYLKNTNEYGKNSIRGKSELTLNNDDKTETGLDRSYVTTWSYGISESFSLLIPNFKGGETKQIGADNKALDNVPQNFKQLIARQLQYWGDQPSISGPAYAGAFIFFLAFLGIFIVKSKIRYALLIGILFTMALAWGKNFQGLTTFFLDNVPFYSKFRAVSSMMVIPLLLIPTLGILALNRISIVDAWNEKTRLFGKEYENKKIVWSTFGIIAGFCFLGYVAPDMVNSFLSTQEMESLPSQLKAANYTVQQSDLFIENLINARKAIFKADVLRSLGILLGGGLLMWLFAAKRLSQSTFIVLVGVLIFIDLFSAGKRYMNEDSFISKKKIENNYGLQPTIADQQIRQDPDPHYRVLNLTVSPFNDATTSYFHKSIGGYHGAKLKIYQDFIEYCITPDLTKMQQGFSKGGNPSQVFAGTHALNMLNNKYIIVAPNQAVRNPAALGNGWFVNKAQIVPDANAEILETAKINPANKVVIRESFAQEVKSYTFGRDSLASIKLLSYDPEELVYESNNSKDGLAVFSEVYYPKNWKAYIDGQPEKVIRANYALRALKVPAGKHEIIFKYEDETYAAAAPISWTGSILILLGVPILFFLQYKKDREPNAK